MHSTTIVTFLVATLFLPCLALNRSLGIPGYTTEDAWCIWTENGPSYSWAITIPHDGSSTVDGKDGHCDCGDKMKDKLASKAVAITDWLVSYLRCLE